jgi:uncharacterized protein (DUF169 family)
MVDSYSSLAPILEDTLGLQLPPVALSFVNDRPPDVPVLETTVPSACAVWMLAETDVFYAPASHHFNCPLGAMVMGFALPEPQSAGLQEELGMMCGIEYVREAELPHVPTVPNSPAGIVYGPLARFPLQPDLVLLWATPQQSMMLSESCGLIDWSAPTPGLLGRPGCGALAAAVREDRPTQSLGCVGMRTNTGISGDSILMAFPGSSLETLHLDLPRVSNIHRQMESHYLDRIAGLEASAQ